MLSQSPPSPEEGLRLILEITPRQPVRRVSLDNALGLVLAGEVLSRADVPPFTNSAMDGYAVRAEDIQGARPDAPAVLQVIGEAPAGRPFTGRVAAGQAVEIMTGAPVPDGADAVVRVEETSVVFSSGSGEKFPHRVEIRKEVAPGTAVRQAGADTPRGSTIAAPAQLMLPGHVGLLASCGVGEVPVFGRPRVALCVGGDEIVAPGGGGTLLPGQIYDSNSHMLRALFRSWGYETEFLGRVPDDPAAMKELFRRGLDYDYLVTVGGVSMGRHDYVRECLKGFGAEEVFWRLNQQPGGPLLFARRGGCLVFGLPGNPVSCYVCSELYLRPSLRRAAGEKDAGWTTIKVQVGEDLKKVHGKTAFLRGRIVGAAGNGQGREPRAVAVTTGPQDSNLIRSVAGHHGYIVFPAPLRLLNARASVDFIVSDGQACLNAISSSAAEKGSHA